MASSQVAVGSRGNGRNVVRGTQSFVGVMAQVWKRPFLTGFEVLWRWTFGVVVLAVLVWNWGTRFIQSTQSIDLQQVEGAVISVQLWLRAHGAARVYGLTFHTAEMAVLICLVWAAVSAAGRGRILQKIEPDLKLNLPSLIILSLLRVVSLAVVFAAWILGTSEMAERMVFKPLYHRQEPGYVQFAAVVIVGTLTVFVLWMAISYVFHLAPLLSMARQLGAFRSLREALRPGPLRGKLIEINLVMGIVKIALIVLAMVFSACPLPFSSVETQEFLTWWWAGVAVWYLLTSDYFHVVRAAAYVSLWRVYKISETSPLTPDAEIAS